MLQAHTTTQLDCAFQLLSYSKEHKSRLFPWYLNNALLFIQTGPLGDFVIFPSRAAVGLPSCTPGDTLHSSIDVISNARDVLVHCVMMTLYPAIKCEFARCHGSDDRWRSPRKTKLSDLLNNKETVVEGSYQGPSNYVLRKRYLQYFCS